MRKLRLVVDRAGTVYLDCPQGRPSAAVGVAPTVTIKTPANADLPTAVSGASATLGVVDTTLSAWSASAPRDLVLTSDTGVVVGEVYLVTDAAGRRTRVHVVGLNAATNTAYLADRPEFDLAAGATFQSTRISYSLPAAQVATRALNYRVEWTYTVGGIAYLVYTLYDVVRHDIINPASVQGIRDYRPELASAWEDLLGQDRGYTRRIDDAFWRLVDEIESRSEKPWCHAVIDWLQCEYAVYERVLLDLAEGGFIPAAFDATSWLDMRRREYVAARDRWIGAIRWLDEDDDLVVDATEAHKDKSSLRMRL